MSTVTICDRTGGQSARRLLKDVSLAAKVTDLRCQVSRLLDLPVHEIELIYRGVCLQDDRQLVSYGLGEASTVHVLKKTVATADDTKPEAMDASSIQQVVTALQAALMNPAHRSIVDGMMSRPETMENLVAATPGLDQDPIALAMIQDVELLAILADPENIHRVIEGHPSLGHAAMLIAAAINEEGAKAGARGGGGAGSGRATYSLDAMSDDDDYPGPSVAAHSQPITANQLAAALAATGGATNQQGQGSSAPSPSQITTDFLQRAMLGLAGGAAQSGTPGGSTTGGSSVGGGPTRQLSETVTSAALQQLRDMGITDEARARQALTATGGDIQAALELLFGEM